MVCVHACSIAQSCSTLCDSIVTHQVPLSMEFSRQEHWSELPFPSLEDLPNPEIEPMSPVSPVPAGRLFTTKPLGIPFYLINIHNPYFGIGINSSQRFICYMRQLKCLFRYQGSKISNLFRLCKKPN